MNLKLFSGMKVTINAALLSEDTLKEFEELQRSYPKQVNINQASENQTVRNLTTNEQIPYSLPTISLGEALAI